MGSIRNWMLGAAVVLGGLGLGATPANAAQFGIYVGGPTAYASPYPGPGYVWVNGYMDNGYWVAGRWSFEGDGDGYRAGRFDRGWDRDRGWHHDRGWHRGWDRDRDRGWHRDRRWNRDDDR